MNCVHFSNCFTVQGPRSKFLSGGGGGGAKEEHVEEVFFLGGGGMLGNFIEFL